MSDKPQKNRRDNLNQERWESVDQPWLIPTNNRLGANFVEPGKRFAEHFVGRDHTASEFAEWCGQQPEFTGRTDYNVIRAGLIMAGYRQDMPEPYDINRTAKQVWEVRSMITTFSDPIMEPVIKATKKVATLFLDRMRASDMTQLTPRAYSDVIALFETIRSMRGHIALYGSDVHRLQQRVQLTLKNDPETLPESDTPLLDV